MIAQVGAGIAFVVTIRPRLAATTERRPDWQEMKPLLSAGRHLLLRVGSMLAVFSGSTAIAARIDDATLAAHQITLTMFFFLALSLDALAVPAQTLVAEELGQRRPSGGPTDLGAGRRPLDRGPLSRSPASWHWPHRCSPGSSPPTPR